MKPDMFASNYSSTEINQIVLDHHVNPSSMEEHDHEDSYLHYFPDPFLDDDELFLSHFLSQQQQQQQQHLFTAGDYCWEEQEEDQQQTPNNKDNNNPNSDKPTKEVVKKKKKKCNIRKIGSCTKRTGGKKDRHSKIYTAQGPRDRRMRLSLQIARKFFDLQDMLGFDKASKTIEWLLSNSNSAIKQLKDSLNNNNNSTYSYGSVSCGSSEVVSEIIRDNNVGGSAEKEEAAAAAAAFMATLKDKKSRQLRTVDRESRDRARARARQRTIFKQAGAALLNSKQTSSFNFQHLNSELQQDTHSQQSPTRSIHHELLSISDLQDFPSIHTFFSGNNNISNNTQLQNLPHSPTLSSPNSIFMPAAPPIPKPYTFSDTISLKLP